MTKTVIISGANRGIGLALVNEFIQKGFKVIAGARIPGQSDSLKRIAESKPGTCLIVPLDVTQDLSVENFANQILAADILINNAGVSDQNRSSLEQVSLAEVERIFQVNVFGTMRLTKALLPKLMAAQNPIIANISSQLGSIADNNSGKLYGYRASKSAVNMVTKSLSIDFPNIISVTLHPGWVQTDMGGPEAPIKPEESSAGIFQIISQLKRQDSGHFYNFRGELISW